jgi:hypothetical protein
MGKSIPASMRTPEAPSALIEGLLASPAARSELIEQATRLPRWRDRLAAAARLLIAIVAAGLWLGGCATPPPPPEVDLTQVVADSPDAVLPRAETVLVALGLSVVEVDPAAGRLQAQQQDLGETAWAQCPDPVVYDSDGERSRRGSARALDLDLVLRATRQQDGSAVALRPHFERTYLNSFTNLEFTRRCRSTGALERAIFERLQAS